jgi:pimeloyl-ACP methyl ester carboxylesterase
LPHRYFLGSIVAAAVRRVREGPRGREIANLVSEQHAGGRAPEVVLVHGWCCHGGFWDAVIRVLGRDVRAFAPQLRGHGGTPCRGRCDIAGFAADVRAAVARAGLRRPLLVGHSLGAAAVLEAAVVLGIPARRLLLVDPFVFDYGRLDERRIRRLLAPFRRDLARSLRVMVNDLMAPGASAELRTRVADAMAATPPEVAIPALEALLRWDPSPALQRLGGECAVLATDCSAREALNRHARRLRVSWLRGVGHFPMMEAPVRLAARIRGFARRG